MIIKLKINNQMNKYLAVILLGFLALSASGFRVKSQSKILGLNLGNLLPILRCDPSDSDLLDTLGIDIDTGLVTDLTAEVSSVLGGLGLDLGVAADVQAAVDAAVGALDLDLSGDITAQVSAMVEATVNAALDLSADATVAAQIAADVAAQVAAASGLDLGVQANVQAVLEATVAGITDSGVGLDLQSILDIVTDALESVGVDSSLLNGLVRNLVRTVNSLLCSILNLR